MIGPQTWKQLDTADDRGSAVTVLRLLPESNFNVFAALDGSSGHRLLLLKGNLPHDRAPVQLPSGRGFNVSLSRSPADPEGGHCLHFALTDRAHAEIFDVVANDILRHIQQSHDAVSAFSAFLLRITEWQAFLNQLPQSGLGEASQQGLFAEIWFLRDHLLAHMPPLAAVSSWAGPKALAKDFQFAGFAIEVKTTVTKQHSRFAVSNEMQLDTGGVGRLFVFGVLMERLLAGGTSLPEMLASARAMLSEDAEAFAKFSELLLLAGYVETEAAKYTIRYSVRSHGFYEVRDDFPRIVEADIRSGVGDVRYSISVAECEPYRVDESVVHDLIKGISA